MAYKESNMSTLSDQHVFGVRKVTHADDEGWDAARQEKTAGVASRGGCTRGCTKILARQDSIHKDLHDRDFGYDHRVCAAGAGADPLKATAKIVDGSWCQMKPEHAGGIVN